MRDQTVEVGSSRASTLKLDVGVWTSDLRHRPGTDDGFTELQQVPKALNVSLEDQALANFAQSYIDPPAPECMWSHMNHHRVQWQVSDPASTLGLSTRAVALATFSKLRSIPTALSVSNRKYVQALARIRIAMDDTKEVTTDQFLLSVVLLSNYEVCKTKLIQLAPPSLSMCFIYITCG